MTSHEIREENSISQQIVGYFKISQLLLNTICLFRTIKSMDCYYFHNTGLFWLSLVSTTAFCVTGLFFLFYYLNLLNRSTLLKLVESILNTLLSILYVAGLYNAIAKTENFTTGSTVSTDFCTNDEISSFSVSMGKNALCPKLHLVCVLSILLYAFDALYALYGYITAGNQRIESRFDNLVQC